jgi:hypothetical protein
MKHARPWLVFPALLFPLLECGSVVLPPAPPVNDCATTASCATLCATSTPSQCQSLQLTCAATENGNACLSGVPLGEFVLVVNVPEGAASDPGATLTVLSSDILCANKHSLCAGATPASCPAGSFCNESFCTELCVELPAVSALDGAYVAYPQLAKSVGLAFDSALTATTIPVRATFIPEWTPPCEPASACTPAPVPASNVNLPLPNLTATTATTATFSMSMTSNVSPSLLALLHGISGPSGSSAIVWDTSLPPGTYGESVVAIPPYDSRIPPLPIEPPLLIENAGTPLVDQVYPPPPTAPTPATALPITVMGLTSPGWTAYLEEQAPPQQIVSSRSSIVNGAATLFTLAPQSLSNPADDFLLVVSPPPDSQGIPELVQTYISGLGAYPYPAIPPPVSVSGKVVSPPGTPRAPVSANLHFVATDLYESIPAGCQGAPESQFQFDVSIATSGEDAAFNVTLPQGLYSVTIDPTDPSSGFAKSIVQAQFPPVGDCLAKRAITGQTLQSVTLVPVTGSAAVADGRPLAYATVSFAPAAFLLTDPSAPAAADWPRSFQVTTDANGNFSAQIDPGTYDITVRPVDGTRFPWVVATALSFPQPPGACPLSFSVPAPSLLSLTLQDSTGTAVKQAVVRAYAFVPCTPVVTEQCNDVALQIGEAYTDTNGSFEMYLAPTPFPAACLGSELITDAP